MKIPKNNGVFTPPPNDDGTWAYEVAYMQTEDLRPGRPFASQQRLLNAGKKFTKGYRLAMDRAMEAAELLDRFAASKDNIKVIPESGQGYDSPSDTLIDTVSKARFSKSELELALGRIQVLNTHAKNINDDPDITGYNTWVTHSVRDARESDLTKGDFADIDRFSGDQVLATDYESDVDGDKIPDVQQAQFRDMSAPKVGEPEWSKRNSQYLTDIRAGRTPRGGGSWGAQNLHSSNGANAGSTIFPRQQNGKPLVTLDSSWGTTENPITSNHVLAPGGTGGMGKPFDLSERSGGNLWPDVLDKLGLVTGGQDMTLRERLAEEANTGGVNLPPLNLSSDGLTHMDGNGTQIDNPYGPSPEELNSSFRDDPWYKDLPLTVLGGGAAAETARWIAANFADSRFNPLRWMGEEHSWKNPKLNVDTPGGVNPLRDSRFGMGAFRERVPDDGQKMNRFFEVTEAQLENFRNQVNERIPVDGRNPKTSSAVDKLNARLQAERGLRVPTDPIYGQFDELDSKGNWVPYYGLSGSASPSKSATPNPPAGAPTPTKPQLTKSPYPPNPYELGTPEYNEFQVQKAYAERLAFDKGTGPDAPRNYVKKLESVRPEHRQLLLEDRLSNRNRGVDFAQRAEDWVHRNVNSQAQGVTAYLNDLKAKNPAAFSEVLRLAQQRAARNPKLGGNGGLRGRVGPILTVAGLVMLAGQTASGAASVIDSVSEGDFSGAGGDLVNMGRNFVDFANPVALGAIGADADDPRARLSVAATEPWTADVRQHERQDIGNRLNDAWRTVRQSDPIYKEYNELEKAYAAKMDAIKSLHTGRSTISRSDLGLYSGDGGGIVDPETIIHLAEEAERDRGVWVDVEGAAPDSPFYETRGYWTHNPQDYDDDR